MTLSTHATDLQATAPSIPLGLDEVGVTGVVRGVVLGADAAPTTARFDLAASLGPGVRGAHMSRFHEAIDHALALVGDDGRDVGSLAVLATVIASRAADLQGAQSAWARIEATVAAPRTSPASTRRTIDPYDTWAHVRVDRSSGAPATTVTTGVRATGMTACPCAQNLVREAARERLAATGMDDEAIAAVLEALPVATHNQRSTGELVIEVPGDGAVTELAPPEHLAALVRGAMSAQVHELLKREDELAVVEAAHADPRFVEDCVRALLEDVVLDEQLAASLPPNARITVRQVNHESIHAHDVVATRSATVAQLRAELDLPTLPA
jgi:GTP cyclohydrolase I/GTP cyclohydrolase-4